MTFCPTHKTVNAYGKDECLRCQGGMMWEQSQTHQTAYFRNHGGTQTDYCIRSQGWSSARYTRDPKKTALYSDPKQAAELRRRWQFLHQHFGAKVGMAGFPRATFSR